MMTSTLILGIGIVLIFVLWILSRSGKTAGVLSGEGADSSEWTVHLPSQAIFTRCLSLEDLAFVQLRSPAVFYLLLEERRRLALKWLRLTRREAGRLYRLHLRAVPDAANLRPIEEAWLLIHIALFWVVCGTTVGLVWLYGPVRGQAFVRSIQELAGVLSGLSRRIVASVPSPVPLASAQ
jgi:hypothetical protein